MNNVMRQVLVAAVSIALTYAWVSYHKEVQARIRLANAEAAWAAEKEQLEAALTAARAKPGQTRIITQTVIAKAQGTNANIAKEIISALIALDPNETGLTRNQTLRMIIAQCERLADCGADALPAIREFLKRNEDVYYNAGDLSPTGERTQVSSSFNPARTDFLAPPSLRLGLLDVLKRIGGPEAEDILAQTLATTGRGVEVAYLTRILEEIAPEKHRDAAVAAAKELLLSPPSVDSPNRLDDNARAYLYDVLKMYSDTSYLQDAQAKLITAEGTIDRTTLGYLMMTLKEDALPLMASAYNDPRLTNVWEKAAVLNQSMKYVGVITQAKDMIAGAVRGDPLPANLRSFLVLSLAGGHRAETPRDPQAIQGRLEFLDSLKRSAKDEDILRTIDETKSALEALMQRQLEKQAQQNQPPPGTPPPTAAPPQ
jgi:hypothetical protein